MWVLAVCCGLVIPEFASGGSILRSVGGGVMVNHLCVFPECASCGWSKGKSFLCCSEFPMEPFGGSFFFRIYNAVRSIPNEV